MIALVASHLCMYPQVFYLYLNDAMIVENKGSEIDLLMQGLEMT